MQNFMAAKHHKYKNVVSQVMAFMFFFFHATKVLLDKNERAMTCMDAAVFYFPHSPEKQLWGKG